jgi:hypothetical protein|tara:strand:+ start:761 stop:1144 length:384 start_codon:yes stop_codon:yes gene_type:complete
MLISKNKINSIMELDNGLAMNEDEKRAIWYAYVGNITCYNLQYEENVEIDFDWKSQVDFIMDKHIALSELKSLRYNIYTNDGNCFVQQKWIDLMEGVINRFEDKKTEALNDNQVLLSQMAINSKLNS